jgi:hypothetical protein
MEAKVSNNMRESTILRDKQNVAKQEVLKRKSSTGKYVANELLNGSAMNGLNKTQDSGDLTYEERAKAAKKKPSQEYTPKHTNENIFNNRYLYNAVMGRNKSNTRTVNAKP